MMRFLDNQYDIEVKGQDHIYLKSVLQLVTQTPPFLTLDMSDVHIWHSDCL